MMSVQELEEVGFREHDAAIDRVREEFGQGTAQKVHDVSYKLIKLLMLHGFPNNQIHKPRHASSVGDVGGTGEGASVERCREGHGCSRRREGGVTMALGVNDKVVYVHDSKWTGVVTKLIGSAKALVRWMDGSETDVPTACIKREEK